jgi:eukaryotic-like serine/threonine-protein kinase
MAGARDVPPDEGPPGGELPPDEPTEALPPRARRTSQYPVAGDPYAREGYAEEIYDEPPPEEPPGWWRRNMWIWLLILLLVVVGGLLLLWFLQRDDDGGGDRAIVPAVVGMTEAQAVEEINDAGLDPVVNPQESPQPEGEVVSQAPGAGTQLAEGDPVVINVSTGPPSTTTVTTTETETVTAPPPPPEPPPAPASVTVPDVVGQDQSDAGDSLESRGIVADSYPVPSQQPAGTVVSQNPAPGAQIPEGQTVRMNVSLGPDERDTAEIPDVTGLEASDARERARSAGFTVRTVYRDAPSEEEVGESLTQSPAAGTTAPLLTQITLFVGR